MEIYRKASELYFLYDDVNIPNPIICLWNYDIIKTNYKFFMLYNKLPRSAFNDYMEYIIENYSIELIIELKNY